jgi:hypothetical protein
MKRPALRNSVSLVLIATTLSLGSWASPRRFAPKPPVYSAPVQLIYDHLQKLAQAESFEDAGNAEEPKDGKTDRETDEENLDKTAEKPGTGEYRNLRELLLGTANDFLTRGWCKPREDAEFDRAECLIANFRATVQQARQEGALDSVEAEIYGYYVDAFTFGDSGTLDLDTGKLWRTGNPKKKPKRNEVELPSIRVDSSGIRTSLADYRLKKERLRALRAKADPASGGEFSPEFKALLSKAYRKKIRGLHEVDALDYAIAKFNSAEIGTLARMMKTAIRRVASGDPKITATYADSGESWSIDLEPSELYNFLLNQLQKDLEKAVKPGGDLAGIRTDITLEDLLLASILNGYTPPSRAAILLAHYPEFNQPKPDRTKIIRTIQDIGRTLLLTQPEIMPFFILGNIVFDTIQRNKAAKKDMNNETSRILIRLDR